jgi:two-component system phosphate regulon response regulator PhoB
MNQEKIWVVEDEEDLLALISYHFMKEGFDVRGFTSGEEMFPALTLEQPDLFLLDIMLPGIDGLKICKMVKSEAKTSLIPVILLTAKSEDGDIVIGLNLGAEDYIPKPFSPKVLMARVKTVLRRCGNIPGAQEEAVRFGDLVIDQTRHEVRLSGQPLPLTATEFRILNFLAKKPGWVFSRDQIISAIHDSDIAVTGRTVDVQIVSLRKKLGTSQHYIQTVRGIGYKFQEYEIQRELLK